MNEEPQANPTTPVTPIIKNERGFPTDGLVLIGLGVLFLLNNFGLISWSIWLIVLRFWPLLLIIIGLKVLLGGTRIGRIVAELIGVFIFASVCVFAIAATDQSVDRRLRDYIPQWRMVSDRWISQTQSHTKQIVLKQEDFGQIEKRVITIAVGDEGLNVAEERSSDYFSVSSSYVGAQGEPEVSSLEKDGTLSIKLSHKFQWDFWRSNEGRATHRVGIGHTDVPSDLNVTVGSGSGTIEVIQLPVGVFNAEVGSGRLKASFQDFSNQTPAMALTVGSGSSELVLPESVALKINYSIGSGSARVNTFALDGHGVYQSDNYDSSAQKVELTLKVGSGEVNIKTR